ncbi:MAG: DUF2029 domain-containing protein [Deltaproteobacteria bacterium]|nr:DUF2029 domain-containing protein [Deltaproteobacteria bacterium]
MKKRLGWLLPGVLLFVITRAFVLLEVESLTGGTDVVRYHERVVAWKLGGSMYRDIQVEYPPPAWWLIALPSLGISAREIRDPTLVGWFPNFRRQLVDLDERDIYPLGAVAGSRIEPADKLRLRVLLVYYHRFRALMAGLDVLGFVAFLHFLSRYSARRAGLGAIVYALGPALVPSVLYDRLDVALLTGISAFLCLWNRQRHLAADAALGGCVALKIFPAAAVPVLFASRWRASRRRAAIGLVAVGAAIGATFLPHLDAGAGALRFLHFHAVRGLEIESVWSSLVLMLRPLGLDARAVLAFHTFELETSIAGSLSTLSLLAQGVIVASCTLRARRENELGLLLVAILGFVVASKVLSPQYLIWLVPMACVVGLEVLRPRELPILMGLITLVYLATDWVYRQHFVSHLGDELVDELGLIPALSAPTVTILVLRNALLIGIVAWLGISSARFPLRERNEPSSSAPEDP